MPDQLAAWEPLLLSCGASCESSLQLRDHLIRALFVRLQSGEPPIGGGEHVFVRIGRIEHLAQIVALARIEAAQHT